MPKGLHGHADDRSGMTLFVHESSHFSFNFIFFTSSPWFFIADCS